MVSAWRPASEAEVATAMAAFVEWLRATCTMKEATPDWVRAWMGQAGFASALHRFMGWRGAPVPARADGHEAVVLHRGGRTAWNYDGLPDWVTARLAAEDAVALASFHLFEAGVRPDDRVLWLGDADDPLALGLYVGATVILADPPDPELARAERARMIRPPPGRAAMPPL